MVVFERPARIAYEAVLPADMSEADREAVRGRIREVLSGATSASDVAPKDVGPKNVGPKNVGPKNVGPKNVGP